MKTSTEKPQKHSTPEVSTADAPREFYVCCKNRDEHGGWMDGCIVWWKANGHGYTYDLNLAGIFTEADQAKNYPDPIGCRYIPRELVDANSYSPRLAFWSRSRIEGAECLFDVLTKAGLL